MLLLTFKNSCVVFLFKVTFWTIAFVLSHPNIYRTIMEDISSVFGAAGIKSELNYIVKEKFE